jgi:hypothetical protein
MSTRILVLALVAAALPVAAADAATVEVAGSKVTYTATPGERNAVTVVHEGPSTLRIGGGAGITLTKSAVATCSHVTLTEIRCSAAHVLDRVVVRLRGKGRARITSRPAR